MRPRADLKIALELVGPNPTEDEWRAAFDIGPAWAMKPENWHGCARCGGPIFKPDSNMGPMAPQFCQNCRKR